MPDTTDNANAGGSGGGTPWHQGVDTAVVAAWQNKGIDLADPKVALSKMWEQYSNLEKHMGVPADRLVRLPKDAADEEGIKAFRQKLGVPNEAKDYDFAGIKRADGADVDAALSDTMRGALHKAGVPKDAAPEVIKAVVKHLDDTRAADDTARASKLAEQKGELQKSWGPKHDENLLAAKQGARRLGVEHETVAALESLIGYDKVMEMFRKVGAGTSEDTFHTAGRSGADGAPTADTAKARLDELRNDPAWRTRLFAGDATAKREFYTLTEQIAGAVA